MLIGEGCESKKCNIAGNARAYARKREEEKALETQRFPSFYWHGSTDTKAQHNNCTNIHTKTRHKAKRL